MQEALDRGEEVRTVKEDLELFKESERRNRERLYSLIQARTAGSAEISADYRLGPEDQIELNVFGVEDLNREVRVSQSGFVSLPLVGGVEIGGLTPQQAEAKIKSKLTRYLRSPEVSISVLEFGSQRISVLGAVAEPGDVLLRKGNNSLVKVLSMAGGITSVAGGLVTVIPGEVGTSEVESGSDADNDSRDNSSKRAVKQARIALEGAASDYRDRGIELPLDAVLGTSGVEPINLPLIGGDVVIVPPAGQVQVEGEVESRGSYDISNKMTLLGALAASGGITYGARVDQIEIVRKLHNNDEVVLVYDLQRIESGEQGNPALRNGDVVRVPSSSGRRVAQDVMQSLRQMINFGIGSNYRLNP